MAYVKKRGQYWHIVFTKMEDGEKKQRAFTLKTKNRKRAERLCTYNTELERKRTIDPFAPNFKPFILGVNEKENKTDDAKVSKSKTSIVEISIKIVLNNVVQISVTVP